MLLKLTTKGGMPITSFRTWEETCQYIADQENQKLSPDNPQFYKSLWRFDVLAPDRIDQIVAILNLPYDRKILLEAWHKQVSMVDMCEGDLDIARQIPLDGRVRLEALREDWCRSYFEDHGLVLKGEALC